MKMRRNTASKVPDILVVLICLSGIFISLWMFWKDMNATMTKQSETPIAEIEFKRRSAQRKFLDHIVWDRLQQHSPIYNGDTIRTADLSQALITFAGSEDSIELSDSSIIQIMMDEDGGAKIDLSGGNININKTDGGGSFTLRSGGNEVAVQSGSRVNIQSHTETEDMSLTVMAGSASLTNAQGAVTMDAGSTLKVSADGKTEPFVTVVNIVPYPDSYSGEISAANIPAAFFWNAANLSPDEAVRLEISKHRAFSSLEQSVDTAGKNNVTLTLDSAGTYYWRIYPSNAGNGADLAEVPSGRIDAAYAQSPELITPADGSVYSYRSKKPAIRMYWISENKDARYKVEIADNSLMNNPETLFAEESSVTYSGLTSGDWYWRITPIYPNNFLVNHNPSRIGHFSIEQNDDFQAPRLLFPAPEALVNTVEEDSPVYFSWKRDPEAVTYTMLISVSQNLENPIFSSEISENYYAYSPSQETLPEGKYYWAVYQKDNEGNISPLSETRSFRAMKEEIEYAAVFPPDNYALADTGLSDTVFTWKSSLSVPNRFQISESSDFSHLLIDETTNASHYQVSTLPAGNYYWRIVSETGGTSPSLSTSPRRLNVIGPLAAARLISPAPDDRLVLRPGTNVNFTWETVDDADHYEFKLYRGDEQIFENLSVENSSLHYSMDRLRQGEYRWTVQAFTAGNTASIRRSGPIASGGMTVRELPRVSLNYPVQGHRYEGLGALNNPDTVRWSSAERLGSSRFILSTSRNPLSNPRSIIMDTRNPGNTVKLPPLREGTYYWTVIASTRDNVDVSAESPLSFRVLPIPLFAAPRAVFPQNRHVFGIEELSSMSAGGGINFEWQPIEGANQYVFGLYTRNESGILVPIVEKLSIRGTLYAYEDISGLLDKGSSFIWRVEAENRVNNGIIERRGNSAEFTFVIDLPKVSTIETKDPGILYGN